MLCSSIVGSLGLVDIALLVEVALLKLASSAVVLLTCSPWLRFLVQVMLCDGVWRLAGSELARGGESLSLHTHLALL